MAKRLNYEIGFTADTTQLKAAINDAQNKLNNISLGHVTGTLTSDINAAAAAATKLSIAMKSATNADTGTLDLSKFAANLKSSGLTLDDYRKKLVKVGPEGTQAFLSVARAVTKAELPMRRSNELLNSLWVTMKNTARWQLTSSALHGFMGGLQTCYGYAKDLNESLNNIRIVTGQSAEQMAEFAKQANKAARQLSTTTTEYTDASLIYYQQGLVGDAVTNRTDTTIKMANVTKQSAQEVSDQLTAIWNNFYDGSKSLEYYADVITALGAATASSSSEISEGLEKFAAIAQSVGLSYEYATSALATVTATTRQSAEVVGTAFKTLFARIQGLKLGETLDDGTTLNKYSQALQAVGINIKDQYGELKNMDVILDEMAGKWKVLTKDQQLALAQTVAGVRQYNQLVALMDNWDFMEKNVALVKDSTGTLQEQADIYAESWEAARDRVTAAAESVYSSLIDEDFFIGLDNGLAGFLDTLSTVINAIGGSKGVLSVALTLMTSLYGERMAESIRNIGYNINQTLGIEQIRAQTLKGLVTDQLQQIAGERTQSAIIADLVAAYQEQASAQISINEISGQISQRQKEELNNELAILEAVTNRVEEYGKLAMQQQDVMSDQSAVAQREASFDFSAQYLKSDKTEASRETARLLGDTDNVVESIVVKYEELLEAIGRVTIQEQELATIQKRLTQIEGDGANSAGELAKAEQQLADAQKAAKTSTDKFGKVTKTAQAKIDHYAAKVNKLKTEQGQLRKTQEYLTKSSNSIIKSVDKEATSIKDLNRDANSLYITYNEVCDVTNKGKKAFEEAGQAAYNFGVNSERLSSALRTQGQAAENLEEKILNIKNQQKNYAGTIIGIANGLGRLSMAISAMQSLGRVFSDEDMTAGERLVTILTSLSMIIPGFIGTYEIFKGTLNKNTAATIFKTIATAKLTEAELVEDKVARQVTLTQIKEQVATELGTKSKYAMAVANKVLATTGSVAAASMAASLTAILPYVAALGVVVGLVYKLAKQYNAEADAAKKAAKEAENANKVLEDTKQKYEDIKTALEDYNEARETLNSMTKGTQEWNDAVLDLNSSVLELLQNYPELSKYINKNNGILEISQEGQEWLQREQYKRVQQANIDNATAQKQNISTTENTKFIKAAIEAIETKSGVSLSEEDVTKLAQEINKSGAQFLANTKDESANEKLAKFLYNSNNYNDNLSRTEKKYIAAVIENSEALIELAQQLQANKEASELWSKQIVASYLEINNSDYIVSSDFVKKTIEEIAFNKEQQFNDANWSNSWNGKGAKDVRAEYQKRHTNIKSIEHKSGKAIYTFTDGTTQEIEDTTIRYRLNQEDALSKISEETKSAITEFTNLEQEFRNSVKDIDTYLKFRDKYVNTASQYNLTQEQTDALLSQSSASAYEQRYQIAKQMKDKFGGDNLGEDYYNQINEVLSQLSNEELAIALDVLPTSTSLDEFQKEFEKRCKTALIDSLKASAQTMGEVLGDVRENRSFEDQYDKLQADKGFLNALAEQQMTWKAFQAQSYDEQYQIVLRYYQQVNQLSFSSYEEQKNLILAELAEKSNQLAALQKEQERYNEAQAEGNDESAAQIKESFEEEYNIPITTNVEDMMLEIFNLQDQLDSLKDQQIDIGFQWDGIDEIEGGFDQITEFAKLIRKEAEKAGNSYLLTASQAKEWMKIYPELFDTATLTTDGLISLDQKYTENFIENKGNSARAAVDEKIKILDAEEATFIAKREILQAEFDAVKNSEEGQIQIEQLRDEQVADLRQRLAQYYMDLGYETADANAKALEDMGIDEQEYSKIVADVAKVNADNLTESAEQGAQAQATTISKLVPKWRSYVSRIKQVGSAIRKMFNNEDITETIEDISADLDVDDGSQFVGSNLTTTFTGTDKGNVTSTFDSSLDSVLNSISIDLKEIDDTLASISAQRTYLESLGKQALEDFDGSRSSSASNNLTIKELKEIEERYHEISREIEYQEKVLKKVENQINRTYGSNKLKLFKDQIETLTKLAELQEKKATLAKGYIGIDFAKLQSVDLNPKLMSNGSLDLDNYTAMLNKARDDYNAVLEKYNGLQSKEQQEAMEDQLDEAEKLFQKRQEYLKSYEESVDTYRSELEKQEEYLRQIADAKLKEITYQVEIKISFKDAEKEIRESSKKLIESIGSTLDHGTKTMILDYENMLDEKNMFSTYSQELENLKTLMNDPDMDQEALADEFNNLRGNIIGSAEALIDWAESLEGILPDAIDTAKEHFNQFINQLQHNETIINTIKEIMVLQGLTIKTSKGYKDTMDIYSKRIQATLAEAKLQREYFDKAAQQLASAQTALDNAVKGTEQYDILKANRDALLTEYNESQEAMLSKAKETIEIAKDMYVDAVERTVYELEQTLTQGNGFDLLQDKYDHYLDTEERYLDTINRIYETTKLNNNLQEEINKTTNAAAAAKLKALQQEFQLREANNKLSQYDIDIMNAKLEMTLKQMALEEAQNAKTSLRLTRNAQGNYVYQYTANQDDINKANEEYLNAANSYYNMAKQQVKNVSGQIVDAWKEMTEAIKDIYEDETLTVDEREARIAEIRAYYLEKLEDLEVEKQKAIADMTDAGQEVIENFRDTHKDVMESMEDDIDRLTEIYGDDLAAILSNSDDFNNQYGEDMDELSKYVSNFGQLFDDTVSKMEEHQQQYADIISETNNIAGTSYDELRQMLEETANSTDEVRQAGEQEVQIMWEKIAVIQTATMEYAAMADSILAAAAAMRELASATLEAQFVSLDNANNTVGDFDKNVDYAALMSSYLQNGGTTQDAAYQELLRQRNAKIEWLQTNEGGSKTSEYWGTQNSATIDMFNELIKGGGNQDWYNMAASIYQDSWEELLKELTGFATGGYTGDFENGKLAILHEKELVLNAEDTKNILSAVQFARAIDPASWIKQLDNSVATGLIMMMERLNSNYATDVFGNTNNQTNATIYAEFPNVHDAKDVEEALRNLVNDASQFVNK